MVFLMSRRLEASNITLPNNKHVHNSLLSGGKSSIELQQGLPVDCCYQVVQGQEWCVDFSDAIIQHLQSLLLKSERTNSMSHKSKAWGFRALCRFIRPKQAGVGLLLNWKIICHRKISSIVMPYLRNLKDILHSQNGLRTHKMEA